jgi:hypothetical protein
MEIVVFHHSGLYNFEVALRFLEICDLSVKEPRSAFETAEDTLFRCVQRDAVLFCPGKKSNEREFSYITQRGGHCFQFCAKMYGYITQRGIAFSIVLKCAVT